MYACMYMLVYLYARNHHLIVPREEFPARKPILPTAGGKRPPPLPPPRRCWSWGRAQELPRPPSCCRGRERDPKRSTAAPEAILAGCSHRHRWVRDTPTHSHHMARVPPRREGNESKPFPRFSLFVIGKDFKRKVLRASWGSSEQR